MNSLCRFCGEKTNTTFDIPADMKLMFSRYVDEFHDSDQLSQKTCAQCCEKFNLFWEFRSNLIQTQNRQIISVNNSRRSRSSVKLYQEPDIKLLEIPRPSLATSKRSNLEVICFEGGKTFKMLANPRVVIKEHDDVSIAQFKQNVKRKINDETTSEASGCETSPDNITRRKKPRYMLRRSHVQIKQEDIETDIES